MNTIEVDGDGFATKTDRPAASSPAVLTAANALYQAAMVIRGLGILTVSDMENYIGPALLAIKGSVVKQTEERKVPALERKPSVIQVGEDKTADFLRAVSRGEVVAFR